VSVCLSIRSHISKTRGRTSPNLLCVLTVAVAPSSAGGVAVCYVLPVSWMSSCFHIMGIRVILRGKRTAETTASIPTEFSSMIKTNKYYTHRWLGTGAKSAIYDCHSVLELPGFNISMFSSIDANYNTTRMPVIDALLGPKSVGAKRDLGHFRSLEQHADGCV